MEPYERWVRAVQDLRLDGHDEHEAFARLVEQFQGVALAWAYAALDDFALAQDAAQEAFVTAYRRIDQLREPRAFPAWLRRIVQTQCNRLTRGKRVATEPLTDYDIPTDAYDPAESAETAERREQVLDALRELPANDREVIELYYMTGYSQDEVAEMLDLPLTTVKKRLQYARERLKQALPLETPQCALGGVGAMSAAWGAYAEIDELLYGYAASMQAASAPVTYAVAGDFAVDYAFAGQLPLAIGEVR